MVPTVYLVIVLATTGAAGGQSRVYAGRPVVEVLQELQAAGLRILFSSDLVPLTLRVKSEPTARDPRQIAEQILAPHALAIEKGPRGTLLVVALANPNRLSTLRPRDGMRPVPAVAPLQLHRRFVSRNPSTSPIA
jgi:hypothetical protein